MKTRLLVLGLAIFIAGWLTSNSFWWAQGVCSHAGWEAAQAASRPWHDDVTIAIETSAAEYRTECRQSMLTVVGLSTLSGILIGLTVPPLTKHWRSRRSETKI